ncbi:MraY family glycosyltransferase [Inconstantimicrobium mannanitabidum]|uniref:Undecaprenyl-phosphate alpha-N-acetylglucosaminyl 1-phosphate transferase n=1 Tax=Inconstantimicrobium mannanitabidum TaxID=1604901 RepID=A0ACB5RCJ6_9CLOT|nr:MraY family glycosyltransferase [Clostridium sp. TW13]GKX66867.1 undecaprenyl-phosphate alpha-N-acetylglucosaminyl 1-phosphate transferase [Clostridium sp. TW13]
MVKYLYAFIISLLIVLIITPMLMKFSHKIGFTDKPTSRKKHNKPMPLCGGIAMYLSFIILYLVIFGLKEPQNIAVVITTTMVMFIGVIDDYYKTKGKEFKIYPRVIIQILAAIILYKSGMIFSGITNPFNGAYVVLPKALQFILSITWMFGVTTVINWSDGMDGLAGGITAISSSTLFVVALAKGQTDSAMMSIILVGSTIGFLRYNRHPAKVFMGDSGANFLGFILAIIALDGAFKQATVVSILIPFLALGVPIFDNIFVIIKRYVEGKPIYKADRSQIHYRLQERGLNTRQVVTYICLLSVCLSLISLVILYLNH